MLGAIKRVVDNNIVFWQDTAPLHLAFKTVLQCQTVNFFSLELCVLFSMTLTDAKYPKPPQFLLCVAFHIFITGRARAFKFGR